jgi:hypothetical protein
MAFDVVALRVAGAFILAISAFGLLIYDAHYLHMLVDTEYELLTAFDPEPRG